MPRSNTMMLRSSGDLEEFENPNKLYRESGRKFKVDLLPNDLQRVYKHLEEKFGEEYALTVVFTVRTAVELHRAWHNGLLTSNILQQIKDKFKLRMTWDLGVIDLTFRFEDGWYELHRRVPYDYDSEFQNLYYKTAVALVERDIGIHDALIFQKELKEGRHTSPGGRFLRDNPGRLVLYPFQAATCALIFFSGDLLDAGVAALCGLVAGSIEWALSSKRFVNNPKESKILIDLVIGMSTGVITGLLFYAANRMVCLRAVFLGTLYWFFYGTAFVIGLLEIISSELSTGVTRFLAVSVKTFVLSLGSAAGLTFVLGGEVYDVWVSQLEPDNEVCDTLGLGGTLPWDPWWRIPLYLLCSVSVLGQYRFIIMNYWAGLLVQLAAYVVQEYVKVVLAERHALDGMDTIFGDSAGAMAAVVTACIISLTVDYVRAESRLEMDEKTSTLRKMTHYMYKFLVRIADFLRIGRGLARRSSQVRQNLAEEAEKQGKPASEIRLSNKDEAILIEDAVEMQEYNYWSLLMPAVYQLVPGSKIAMYWYNIILPPQPYEGSAAEGATVVDSAGSALWITSLSLALGLIMGLAVVRILVGIIISTVSCIVSGEMNPLNSFRLRQFGRQEMTRQDDDDDPDDCGDLSHSIRSGSENNGLRKRSTVTTDTNNDAQSPRSVEEDV